MNTDWRNDWVLAGTVADVAPCTYRAVTLEGSPFLLVRLDEECFVAADRCPGGRERLRGAAFRDGRFHCRTHGEIDVIAPYPMPPGRLVLETLPVIVVDDEVFVSLPGARGVER